ncbi:HAMP domain-containing sensor histidine kinase [Actinoplanes regularis]|uniref:Signal transduction histidine-protein kinase/phosphatase MprB n=1 Tax=Actinoplanes regularis TaxID=52697 RepID=A0A239EHB3_9ACTN|nr:HAMP domain-containing sensor histidine kinase [Actinoplanes regularis]GIE89130.1 two-component sensor histidine kinase [Actinoplanes regularis]GLW34791.1 two-component sensor histidine kinase [Actinoplanes regularis]SNS44036.1 Signal transduction histidine kinase [Actinoplanes regularis]
MRLAYITAATTAVAALVFLVPLGWGLRSDHREKALSDAALQTATVAGALVAGAGDKGVAAAVEAAGDPVVHTPGLAPSAGGRASAAEIDRAATGAETSTLDVAGGVIRLHPVTANGKSWVIETFVPDAALGENTARDWWLLLGLAVLLVGGSVIVVDRLARGAVDSANNLVEAALAVGDGDLGVRIHPSGPRELAEVGYAFNRMADRLVTSRTDERELVADLSHRLRTPLTALRLDAEALDPDDTQIIDLTAEEVDRRRGIRRIRQAIASLDDEVNQLINTTRQAVAAQVAAASEEGLCDASEVVRERMTFWSALADDQNRQHRVLGAQMRIPVPVARAELAAALDAVLGNVFRYTPQGTAFEVALSRRDGWVALRVDDAGQGIPDPEKALRRGQSQQGSTGLGLDIARRMTQSSGGSVSLDRAAMGGASVVMLIADAEATPKTPSRFGLVGRGPRGRRGQRGS